MLEKLVEKQHANTGYLIFSKFVLFQYNLVITNLFLNDFDLIGQKITSHMKIKKALNPFYHKNIFDRKWM